VSDKFNFVVVGYGAAFDWRKPEEVTIL